MQRKENHSSTKENKARAKASTQDILGNGSKQKPFSSKWSRHHNSLIRLREDLLAKKGALAEDANAYRETPLFGEHMADAATDSYDRDWALTMLSTGQNSFYEVEQALQRIRNGTYGICELTGKPIESERLLAIPWTRFSAKAQRELETKGLLERPRLGELGSFSGSEESAEAEEETTLAAIEEKPAK